MFKTMRSTPSLLKNGKLYVLDGLSKVIFNGTRDGSGRKKILIIHLGLIGDAFLWFSTIDKYRQAYPKSEYELILCGDLSWKEIVLKIGIFDDYIFIDRKDFVQKPFYRLKVLKKIRRFEYETIIHTHYSREFLYGDSIIRIARGKNKIGWEGDDSNISHKHKKISDRWYTHLVKGEKGVRSEIIRNFELLEKLTSKIFEHKIFKITFDLKKIENLPEEYFLVVPGSSNCLRNWPKEYFSEIIDYLCKKTKMICVICGTKEEEGLGKYLEEKNRDKIINIVGKTDLIEYIRIIKNAKFLIANETSAGHIAASVGTKSFILVSGVHYERFYPYSNIQDEMLPVAVASRVACYNCNGNLTLKCQENINSKKQYLCVSSIAMEDVKKEIEELCKKF